MSLVFVLRMTPENRGRVGGFAERRHTLGSEKGRVAEGSHQQVETLGLSLPADAVLKERTDCVSSNQSCLPPL